MPLIEQAAVALDGLSRRELFIEPGDLVFPGPTGEFLDYSALGVRFYDALRAAGLRHLRDQADDRSSFTI